ncbi:4-diphosphocytidyl-2-C-methyl-D-erythritol kinase [Treponema bryantii]|uniref:4-diphosphocytidyl-2-C-methyl-D-erythritol kinase n=1 Tax=Treponema bryantii TaxID=163 RepID=A0A1H9HW27_9SPIR|nr:4-(cytidine 5'-diphospho)-2-C-methyl-D-erythritol kinase [Treponema bryantii]SEQ66556.1 4-diphosphocytidyl-2-C-methyl-D-erythritol kinase [Treponema bryantii]
MEHEISGWAYAKINFGLRVLPGRADGFHGIESIFQTVDLFDELTLTVTAEKGCFVHCSDMELPENNTLTKAYNAFCKVVDCEVPGVKVELKKGIPSGGGLGGGSSDAAALVRMLEKLCNVRLSDSDLDNIAAETGSDVFFFMHCDEQGRGCALVSGRGEVVKKIHGREDLFLVLIFPKVSSSTKEAYALVDEAFAGGKVLVSPEFDELELVYRKPPENWTFINTFTPVISKKYEEIGRAIEALKALNCNYAQMSGSGSTVFGVFASRQLAESAVEKLADSWNCKLARTV